MNRPPPPADTAAPAARDSPCLQGTPATVGIGGSHAICAGGMQGTGSHAHSGHLWAGVPSSLLLPGSWGVSRAGETEARKMGAFVGDWP